MAAFNARDVEAREATFDVPGARLASNAVVSLAPKHAPALRLEDRPPRA
ncbi:MAG TPA: hypothetical protein VKT30_18015 [Caulobacteraceae bacterium]|nr:hypothetical protein [Caulobacteraceae bacterium]